MDAFEFPVSTRLQIPLAGRSTQECEDMRFLQGSVFYGEFRV